ncbi:unnamed protein product [Candida verbasci]|uniref:Mannosyltransferase n=1 Tax=Candida verbasci TaxID=1227364 RepID=A0A9W4TT69_9ASCO|nr:unnamed protein product [Candida verbasci]
MRRYILISLITYFAYKYYTQDNTQDQCFVYSSSIQLKQFIKTNNQSNFCIRKSSPINLQNATILMLCRNEDVFEVLETIQNFEDRFNKRYHYDYTFFNDVPFSQEFIYLVSNFIPHGKISFGLIPQAHWNYPPHIDQDKAREVRESFVDVPYGDSETYRHMCRFYSGFFYHHPLVQQYQYYWRTEPGVKLLCDVNYDVFQYMQQNGKLYGYVLTLFEYSDTIPTLWQNVLEYIKLRDIEVKDSFELVINKFGWFNLCHFWSNFEIANLEVFNDDYDDFFQFLDSNGGFYYERWGDAPIHTLGIALFQNKSSIHWFDDIGYYHSPYLQCPQDLNTYIDNKCVCDIDQDFGITDLSCNRYFSSVLEDGV